MVGFSETRSGRAENQDRTLDIRTPPGVWSVFRGFEHSLSEGGTGPRESEAKNSHSKEVTKHRHEKPPCCLLVFFFFFTRSDHPWGLFV